jgi:hypothetical protein
MGYAMRLRTTRSGLLLTATILSAMPPAALGQTQYHTPPLVPPLAMPSEPKGRGEPTPPSSEGRSGTSTSAPEGSLSDELSRSHGVIQPPPTGDRGVVQPPPDTSRTPVIPPPGTPGGNPGVQAK